MAMTAPWVPGVRRALASMRCACVISEVESPALQRALVAAGHAASSGRQRIAYHALQHLRDEARRASWPHDGTESQAIRTLAIEHLEETVRYLRPTTTGSRP